MLENWMCGGNYRTTHQKSFLSVRSRPVTA